MKQGFFGKVKNSGRFVAISLVCCLLGYPVQSEVFSDSFAENEITVKESSVRLYNFSDELIEAAESCTPYSEDFTTQNPELQEWGVMLGGVDFQVLVDVQGQKDGKCSFSVLQLLGGLGGTKYSCSIDEEQQKELVLAMKSRSTEFLTETYTSYMMMEDEEDGTVEKIPVKNTISGSLFDIAMAKVMANSCKIEEYTPTEGEQQSAYDKFNKFSDHFIESLKTCTADVEEKIVIFISLKVEVIGKRDDKCLVRYDAFDLLLSEEEAAELSGFDKLGELIKKPNVAEYNRKDDYKTNGLLSEIANCYNNQNNDLQGISSSKSFEMQSSSSDDVKVTLGLASQYEDNHCVVKLNNQVEIGNQVQDYSLSCFVDEELWAEIQEKYADVLAQNEEKSENEIAFFSTENNKLSENADKEIFEYLKENGLCR